MAKNSKKKDSKRRDQSVFKVASKVQKSKNKAKPVTTNIKKMNLATKAKTEQINKQMPNPAQMVKKQTKPAIKPMKKKAAENKPVDMDTALADFSKL